MNHSFKGMFKVLGLTKKELKGLKYEMKKTALHHSHTIVIST